MIITLVSYYERVWCIEKWTILEIKNKSCANLWKELEWNLE